MWNVKVGVKCELKCVVVAIDVLFKNNEIVQKGGKVATSAETLKVFFLNCWALNVLFSLNFFSFLVVKCDAYERLENCVRKKKQFKS